MKRHLLLGMLLTLAAGSPLAAANRWLVYGDSISAGTSWPANCGICPVIFDCTGGCDHNTQATRDQCGHARRLDTWLGGGTANYVKNEGVGGEDTAQGLIRFPTEMNNNCAGSPGECIAVLLMHGTNDMAATMPPVSPESARDNLSAMIDVAKGRNVDVLLMSIVRKVYDMNNTKWLAYRNLILELASTKNLQSVDPYTPLCNDNWACYNRNYWVDQANSVPQGPTDCTDPGEGDNNLGHLDPDGYDVLTNLIKAAFPASAPASPAPTSPMGDIGNTTPDFVWPDVATGRWYELKVDGSPSTTWWEGAAVCTGGICTVNPGTTLSLGSHTWQVRGRNLRGLGAWSALKNFVIWATPGTPVGSSPIGTYHDPDPPTPPSSWEPYTWSMPANASVYDLTVSNSGGPVLQQSFTSSVCAGSTCSASPGVGLAQGSYSWTVRARNPGATGAASAPRAFGVVGPPGTATPVGPTGELFEMAPRYEWLEAPGATEYDLEVKDSGGNVDFQANGLLASSVCSGGGCSYVGTVLSDPDGYTFNVRGRNAAGAGPLSSPGVDFTIIECVDDTPRDLHELQPSPIVNPPKEVVYCGALSAPVSMSTYTVEPSGDLTIHTRDGFTAFDGFSVNSGGKLTIRSP